MCFYYDEIYGLFILFSEFQRKICIFNLFLSDIINDVWLVWRIRHLRGKQTTSFSYFRLRRDETEVCLLCDFMRQILVVMSGRFGTKYLYFLQGSSSLLGLLEPTLLLW
jgi:hypothetical protein